METVVFTPDGKYLLTASNGRLGLYVWDVEKGTLHGELKGLGKPVAISPGGELLATGDFVGTVYLWRLPDLIDGKGGGNTGSGPKQPERPKDVGAVRRRDG